MSQDEAFGTAAERLLHTAYLAIEEAASYISDIEDKKVKEDFKRKFKKTVVDIRSNIFIK